MDPKEEIKMLMARMARTSNSDEKYRVLELINKLSLEDQAFGLVQKSRTLIYLNNHAESLEAAQQAIQLCLQNEDQTMLLASYVREMSAYSLNNAEEAWKSVQKAEKLINSMSSDVRKQSAVQESYLLMMKASQYFQEGDFKNAIETNLASVEVGKSIPKGESYSARWYWSYQNLAEVYLEMGDLEKAHSALKKYLEGREKDPLDSVHAYPLANMGLLLLEKGDFKEARSYLIKSLEMVLKSGEEESMSDVYFYLFKLTMAEGLEVESKSIVDNLMNLSRTYPDNNRINNLSTLTNAVLLKNSTNVRSRIKAQDLLIDLVEKTDWNLSHRIWTMKHLCDTYLDEIKMYGHEQAFFNAQNIIEQIGMIATNQNSMRFLIESYLLRARMKLIEGDFDEAESLYQRAEAICEEKNLKTLGEQVTAKKTEFDLDIKHMQNLLARNASLQERLKQAHIEDYLNEALHIVKK